MASSRPQMSLERSPAQSMAARWAGAVAVVAAIANALAHVGFIARGHVFACEDDPYRLYNAYLLSRDASRAVGLFWLPGQFFALAALFRLGVPAAWAGPLLGTLSTVVMAFALGSIARSLAPQGYGETAARASYALVFASPMTLVLAHSALAETQAAALLATSAALYLRSLENSTRNRWLFHGASALTLLLATWVRYECWVFVPVLPLLALRAGRANGLQTERILVGLLPALGPVAWMALQAHVHGDALGFLRQSHAISESLLGPASPLRVLADRCMALLTWSLPVLVWAGLGFALLRRERRPLRATMGFVALGTLPVIAEVMSGHEQVVFPARFAYEIESGAIPLAAIGVALALASDRRTIAGLALVATVFALAAGALEPPALEDEASVRLGLALRAGDFDRDLHGGALLVERPRRRPPFGWASVGVLWEHWDRVVWATPSREGWTLVEPTDVRTRPPPVPTDALGPWLARRGITAAWVSSDELMRALRTTWPGSTVRDMGDHALIVRR